MLRLLKFAAITAIAAALFAVPMFISRAGSGASVSVIVELRDDPGAVYQAKTEKSGGSISAEQLQAHRDQLSSKQDEFLNALSGNGVTYSVVSRDIKNFDGSITGTIALRYTLVYDGMALNVPASAIDAIKAMPEVKSVQPNAMLYTSLNNSVKYIRAPEVYGDNQEVSQFDNPITPIDGYEGQNINVAIIDLASAR